MSLRRPRVVVLVAVLVLLAAAWTALRLVQARRHLETARGQLETARTALLDRDLDAAAAAVRAAGQETGKARSATSDPVVWTAAHVPLLGRSVAVVRGVARGADDIAGDVLPPALDAARGLDPKALRRPDGSVDLALLAKTAPAVTSAATGATEVADRVDDLPTRLLPGPVRSARDDFAVQADELASSLRRADDALGLAPTLLGAQTAKRWLVLVQQTSESRGTGGIPGGFAVLEARRGKLTVLRTGSNADLVPKRVDPVGLPKDYVERYDLEGAFDIWQNVNLSPDLPVVARYVVQRWKAQFGQELDGVIALDARALEDLLRGSGPVQVKPGRTIAPDQVAEYLALGQYEGEQSVGDQRGRKEELTLVADAVVSRLTGGGGDSEQLLRGLTSAVRSGHLRMAVADPATAAVLHRTGADGSLPTDDAPFVYPVLVNGAGNKLDYFLDRDVRWTAGDCDGDRRSSVVEVSLGFSPPPAAQLPPYVSLRQAGGKIMYDANNRVGVSVYATKGASLRAATLDGGPVSPQTSPPLVGGSEHGLPVWTVYLDLTPGSSRTLRLELDEPTASGRPRVLEQPLARDQRTTVEVPSC